MYATTTYTREQRLKEDETEDGVMTRIASGEFLQAV